MRRVVFSSAIVTIFAVGTLFASVVVAQQSDQVEQNLITVTITENSLQVTPSDASLTANTPFRVAIENQTGSAISLVLELPGGVNQPVQVSEGNASISAAPGQILDQVWTVPTAGSYQLAVYKNNEPPAVSARSVTLTIGGQQAVAEATATVSPADLQGGIVLQPSVTQPSPQVEQNFITALTVIVTENSLQVTPSDGSLAANTPFTVTVENQTGSAISLVLEPPGGVNQPVQVSEGNASVSAAPGQILDQVWTVPTVGSYQLAVYKYNEPPAVSARSATLTIGGQ